LYAEGLAEGLGWLGSTPTALIFGRRRTARPSAPRAIPVVWSWELLTSYNLNILCIDYALEKKRQKDKFEIVMQKTKMTYFRKLERIL
jgi:hypothetical protein